jgi:sugar phosphate isomerase/epimerase
MACREPFEHHGYHPVRRLATANPLTGSHGMSTVPASLSRRRFLQVGAASVASLAANSLFAADKGKPTQFQIACMTLVYGQFPLERALTGLQSAGYRYVAWGTNHAGPDGKRQPIMAENAPAEKAKELGKRCRDLGLEPLLMFSGIYPDAKNHLEVMNNRIRQAAAAGIPHVLTFGNTDPKRSDRKLWVEHFKQLGPVARDHGVLIVLKPHGGLTARGSMAAEIIRDVADDGVKVNYDAGNVMDYLKLDAPSTLADLRNCSAEVRSFCIKDHRLVPKDEDCGPGLGEIDHYQLLQPVAFTGRPLPLCCENIFAPLLPRPTKPEGVDALARRAREFLETVIQGLQT